MDHDLETREDGLANCLRCGGAEASLPTRCPGRRMSHREDEFVQSGLLDFTRDGWVLVGRLTEGQRRFLGLS